jgi:signal peptidase I
VFIVLASILMFAAGCVSRVQFKQVSTIMTPTIQVGEVVTADFSAFRKMQVQRWDVVIFLGPFKTYDTNDLWCMRIIGLPGESIFIAEDGLFINGNLVVQPKGVANIRYRASLTGAEPVTYPYAVPKGSFFVLGDNTTNAHDSRFWGALDETRIVGKVIGK